MKGQPITMMNADSELKIHPFLVVTDAANAVAFYVNAFEAVEEERYGSQGKTTCKVSIGGAEFWVGDEEPEYNNYSPVKIGGSPVRIILTTPNPDAIFARALSLGAIQICPVTVEDFWKIGKLQDPYGHIWEIGCKI